MQQLPTATLKATSMDQSHLHQSTILNDHTKPPPDIFAGISNLDALQKAPMKIRNSKFGYNRYSIINNISHPRCTSHTKALDLLPLETIASIHDLIHMFYLSEQQINIKNPSSLLPQLYYWLHNSAGPDCGLDNCLMQYTSPNGEKPLIPHKNHPNTARINPAHSKLSNYINMKSRVHNSLPTHIYLGTWHDVTCDPAWLGMNCPHEGNNGSDKYAFISYIICNDLACGCKPLTTVPLTSNPTSHSSYGIDRTNDSGMYIATNITWCDPANNAANHNKTFIVHNKQKSKHSRITSNQIISKELKRIRNRKRKYTS